MKGLLFCMPKGIHSTVEWKSEAISQFIRKKVDAAEDNMDLLV